MAILSGALNGPLAFGVAGPSAYEVAVKNGFVGSEEAWLDSLRGEPFVYEDFTQKQLESLKGKQGDPGKDGEDGFSPEITVEKAGKVTTITITDATGTYTAKINDGADGKNGQDGADGKDSVGVVIYRTTADLTDEMANSVYPFDISELDTTGGTPEVGDWIIDKYLRLYQIGDAYGTSFDSEWIATLSREGGQGEDGGYYIPNVELLESNHLKFSYTATKEGMPGISDRYFELPGSGGNVDLTGVVRSVNGQKPDENGNVEISVSGGNTTQKEEITTVSVGAESVTLDSDAPEQTVNLAWTVDNARTIPAFTNYYIEKNGRTYPFELGTSYNHLWNSSHGHGNADAFVSGHEYFVAMKFELDGESTAEYWSGGNYISPTNSNKLSGSGWYYELFTPSATGQSKYLLGGLSGTGRVHYLYCIDVTALEEAGLVKEGITLNELAELFGKLPLVPGQNYAGGTVGDGTATLNINRGGKTITVGNTSSTATVKGGDILSVVGGSITFLLKVIREVFDNPESVWTGKKWVAFGDSLTDEGINADKKYYRYIEEKTGITVVVMGQGGTGYYRTYDSGTAYGQRMARVPADADIITIFGSVNDWHTKGANVAMGNASDTREAGTLAGYINECIDVAIEKAPYAQIALVTPMDYYGLPRDTLEGIANIIKAVAAYRQIKCLDLYHESGFRVGNPVFAKQFTTDYSETAESYGHPNNLAHEKLIAPEFMELLKRMILTV